MAKGNLVNWDDAEFELYNMTEENLPVDMVCKSIIPGDIIYPAQRPFHVHNAVCRRYAPSYSLKCATYVMQTSLGCGAFPC